VHPREVFKAALQILRRSFSAIPIRAATRVPAWTTSVDSPPVDAGTLLGVDVLDHIIVGDGRYYSFKEGGLV
jgi:DNA repair protein RadC